MMGYKYKHIDTNKYMMGCMLNWSTVGLPQSVLHTI